MVCWRTIRSEVEIHLSELPMSISISLYKSAYLHLRVIQDGVFLLWVSHTLWFWFAFPWWLIILRIFSSAYEGFVNLFLELIIQDLAVVYMGCLAFCWVVSLYILGRRYMIWKFSHSMDCLSPFLIMSCDTQNSLILKKSSYPSTIIEDTILPLDDLCTLVENPLAIDV